MKRARRGILIGSRLVIALMCFLCSHLALSQALEPYTASYKTTAMGLGMTLKRELIRNDDGSYTLSNRGSVLFMRLEEIARFQLVDNRIISESFDYRLSGLISRKRSVRFEPDQGIIRSLRKKKWTELPWEADIYDRLSQQEQLRLALMGRDEPPSTIDFRVVDGPNVRERVMEWVGNERITVPAGSFDVWHYRQRRDDDDRASDIWVAPELAFLMVLTRHREDDQIISIELAETSLAAALP